MVTRRFSYHALPIKVLLVCIISGIMTVCAMGEEKSKKPPLADKPGGGSVSHTVNTGSRQNSRQDKPTTGVVDHEVKTEKNNPPQVCTQPTEPKRASDDNSTNNRRNKPVLDTKVEPPIVIPDKNNRNEQKPILVITNPDGRMNDRAIDRKPIYLDGRYRYSSRPNYAPSHFGYWAFDNDLDYCKSIYFYYGYFPYLDRMRVYVNHYDVVEFNTKYINSDSDEYYLAGRVNNELDYVLSDIRKAWLDGRADILPSYVRKDQLVAVLLDGKYDYSVESDDYVQMTFDAIDQTRTVRFTWESIRQRTDGGYTAFAKHTYRDPDENEAVVYVSYTLNKIGRNYFIVEVGSSKHPLN